MDNSDFEDSFLETLLRSEPLPVLPFPGQRLGGPDGRRFEVLEWMGGGGMGQVFRARDETLRREVALKFLLPRPGFEAEALAEARAVARLDHENIVRIFDVGTLRSRPEGPDVPFLVMECLEGEPLAARLKRGRLEVGRALEVLEGICAGLEHAHERGIVHRDLKPGNVFLTRKDVVKLLDFGLSHMAVRASDVPHLPTVGTPAYMAPEQWRREPPDARTDIWSAGVVLYELLTGELPVSGATWEELRERVTSREPVPSVRARNPEVPREVESLLATALAKEPARRFHSARELRRELHELRARLTRSGAGAAGPVTRQRRQLVLLCCQLTGMSGLVGRVDAEELGELEAAFHQGCEELLRPYEGGVTLAMGAEVFACFGGHQVREDDAEHAVRAGLCLARDVPEWLQRRLPHLPLPVLGVKVGLHTDRMVLDTRAMRGEAPRVVSWLAAQAGPGEVLASETTWKQVRGAFETERLGTREFTGLAGPATLRIHRVRREREVGRRFERRLVAGGLSPLVGRESELRWLRALWDAARGGRGAVVLLRGEAGIGKSRLLQELRERVPSEAATQACFQCWSQPGASALPPTAEVLQRLLRFSPEGTPARHLAELEARLGELGLSGEHLPLLGQLLALPIPEDSPVFRLTAERRREKADEALGDLLLAMSRRHPVFLAVEDLHWADSSWLGLLATLLERLEGARLLIVLTARPEFQPAWPARAGFHVLALERLPAGLATALVKEVAGARAPPEETVRELVRKADGIPLFIEELTRRVVEDGEVASIPATLHELLLARLDLLPSRQKALAQLGAVVGRDFSLELLAALTGHGAEGLRRELGELVAAGLLQEAREGTDASGFQFRHALFQEAAYESLPRDERRRHHQRVARVLEERFPAMETMRPEVLAYHLTEAGEHARALPCWIRAGWFALQRMAIPEFVKQLSQALELLPRLPRDSQLQGGELQLLSIQGFSQAMLEGFDSPEAARIHDRLREMLRRMEALPPGLEETLWSIFTYYQLRADFPSGHDVAEQVVRLGERQRSPELLATGHGMLSVELTYRGRIRRALEHSELAVAWSRSRTEPHWAVLVSQGLAHASIIHAMSGGLVRAREYCREGLELVRQLGEPLYRALTLTYMDVACLIRRDVQEAVRLSDEVIAISSERSHWVWPTWARAIRGWVMAEQGRPREGLVLTQQQAVHWRERGLRGGLTCCFVLIAEMHLRLGQLREGLVVVDETLREVGETGEHGFKAELHRVRGELLHAAGQEREAQGEFLRARAMAHEQGALLFELRATVGLGRLLRDTGRPEAARKRLTRVLAHFEEDVDSADLREARALLEQLSLALRERDGVRVPELPG
ncbi:protein kinase domain-containing protein [Archangium violaceum]|uniref:protein kinase domain-containing protein n=1 Tax=Archangium violaceum TaxID=83451 RepID=UPI000697374B|nr:protein kinase [Archangium violaceum]